MCLAYHQTCASLCKQHENNIVNVFGETGTDWHTFIPVIHAHQVSWYVWLRPLFSPFVDSNKVQITTHYSAPLVDGLMARTWSTACLACHQTCASLCKMHENNIVNGFWGTGTDWRTFIPVIRAHQGSWYIWLRPRFCPFVDSNTVPITTHYSALLVEGLMARTWSSAVPCLPLDLCQSV